MVEINNPPPPLLRHKVLTPVLCMFLPVCKTHLFLILLLYASNIFLLYLFWACFSRRHHIQIHVFVCVYTRGVFLPPIMPFWKESVLFLSFLWHFIINARFQSTILCLFFPSSHTSPSGLWPFHYHRGQYINNILCTHKRFYVIVLFLNCWILYWFKPYI